MSPEQFIILGLTGLLAGFAGGLFGIGGGVIIVPALYTIFLANGVSDDVAIKVAVGTSLATIIVTSIRSLQGHHSHDHVEWPILKSWAGWIAAGAVFGAVLARFATASALTLFFGAALFLMGIQKLVSARRDYSSATLPGRGLQYGIAGLIGAVSSLLGIGGGVMGVLVLTHFGRSLHRAIGTAAGFGLLIAVPGALGYAIAGWGQADSVFAAFGYISIPAFVAVALGTAIAAPYGARAAARLNAQRLNAVFAIYMLITSVLMIREGITS
ncbi:MAG: sulfite exporter TauE/SafE family protein [Parvularcula sp.]